MYRDKDKLAINVAKLYYRSDFSQQKIAQELGVSRPSISRLLQYAKDKGYVNIQIVDPVEDMSIMEQRLKDKLHLKDVKSPHLPSMMRKKSKIYLHCCCPVSGWHY